MTQSPFLCKNRGQSIIQYVGLLTICALFISGITIYLQRALKGGMHKAQNYAGSKMPKDGVKEYEPYYLNNHSTSVKGESGSVLTFTGGKTIYTSSYDKSETDFINTTCAENGTCELPPPCPNPPC